LVGRSELGPAIGSAVSATGAGVSWVTGNPFLTAVFAAFAGSFVTIYFTGVQQRQSWKREVAVRMTTELYGPLYVDIWNIIQVFETKRSGTMLGSGSYSSDLWPKIVADYRYRVIDVDLRKRLDEFYQLLKKTSSEWYKIVNLSDAIFKESTRAVLGKPNISYGTWACVGTTPSGGRGGLGGFNPVLTISLGTSVMDYVHKNMADYTKFEFTVQVQYEQGPGETLTISEEQAETIFSLTESHVQEDEVFVEHEKKRKRLLEMGTMLRERLGVIVEEPWKS
jgi:hypothetical protein